MAIEPTQRPPGRGGVDSTLRWIGDLDHPFYDDERQRFVWYEASAIGFQMLLVLQLVVGPAASLFAVGRTGAIMAVISTPSLIAAFIVVIYASAKGVSYAPSRSDLKRSRTFLLLLPLLLVALSVGKFGFPGDPTASADASGFSLTAALVAGAALLAGTASALWFGDRTHGDDFVDAAGRSTSTTTSARDRVLRWVGDLDHPFYNDERNRFVWYEGSAIGFQFMLIMQMATSGIALLAFGWVAIPAAMVGLVPALWTAIMITGYAHRRGARYFPKTADLKRSRGLLGAVVMLVFVAAMVRLSIDTPADASGFSGGFNAGFSQALPLAFAVGIVTGIVVAWVGNRRQQAPEDE